MGKKLIYALVFIVFFVHPACAVEVVPMSIQEIIIQPVGETIIYTNIFKNDTISIQLRLSYFAVATKISNLINDVMMVSWGKSAFVDVNGNSHKVVPGETLVIDKTRQVPETMIPPHSSAELLIFPTGFWNGPNKPWKMILDYPCSSNIFGIPTGIKGRKTKGYATFARKYEGRTLGLMLCFTSSEGGDKYYKFDLQLDFAKGLQNIESVGEEAEGLEESRPAFVGLFIKNSQIEEVKKGSLAEKAGLANGDIILEVNGIIVTDLENLQGYIEKRASAGSSVMILYERNGQKNIAMLKNQ